jgi:glycosylphosphatidylinositol phospholipase D
LIEETGIGVSGAGDMNGDGIDDLVVGAPGSGRDRLLVGYTFVVYGRDTRLVGPFPPELELATLLPPHGDGSLGFVLTGIYERENAGTAVSGGGDVNGDGLDDLLIGADNETFVVFGREQGFPALFPLRRLTPGAGGDGSEGCIFGGGGWRVRHAGDVDGDGIGDSAD